MRLHAWPYRRRPIGTGNVGFLSWLSSISNTIPSGNIYIHLLYRGQIMTPFRIECSTQSPLQIFCIILLGFIIALPGRAQADAETMEGTVGWSYYIPGGAEFTSDPVNACRLTAKNHMNTHLSDMRISPWYPDGTWYQCKYPHFLAVAGEYWYGATYLKCKTGYTPKSPGVCVSNSQPPAPPSCSIENPNYIVANPITVATGGKFQTETDLVVGSSDAMNVTRTYRTFRSFASGQSAGPEWSFSFDRVFFPTPVASGHLYIIEGALSDGNYFKFEWDSSKKKYISAFDKAATLEELSPSQDDFLLTQGGKIERFGKMSTNSQSKFVLLSSQDIDGSKRNYRYDPSTLRLNEIADEQGRTIHLTWGADGAIETLSSAESTVTYHYDSPTESFPSLISRGRLRSVDYIDNVGRVVASKKYDYDDAINRSHLLTGITDENGEHFATYAYDSAGRATLSEHGNGAERYILSYPDANTRVITDPLGTVRTITLQSLRGIALTTGVNQPGGAGCNAASNTIAHDYTGNVISQTDFNGSKTCYAYESGRGLEIARVSGLAAATSCPATVDTALKVGTRRVRTAWHSLFPLKTASSEPELITKYYYNGDLDSNGQITSCAPGMVLPNQKPFPMLCRKTMQTTSDIDGARGLAANVQGVIRSWNYSYDEQGRLLKASSPADETGQQKVDTYSYYTDTSDTHFAGDLATATNAAGETSQYLEYSPDGLVTKLVRPDAVTLNFEYDSRKRLLKTILRDTQGNSETTSYEYDPAGNIVRVTQPDQSASILSYDTAHRLTQIEDTSGNSVRFTLDGAGNVIHHELRGPNQEIFTQLSRSYDSLNRLQRQKNGPDDSGIAYQYDANGNMTAIIDQLGRITSRQHDIFNRLVRVQTPPPQLNAPRGLTSFGYDNKDFLTSVTDPRLLTTSYTIDGFGQRIGTSSPDTGFSSLAYDGSGTLKTKTDARGITTPYRWGATGRIIQRGGNVFEYGTPGSGAAGRLKLLRDDSGQTSFSYDGFGRLQTKTQVVNVGALSRSFTLVYTYGSSGTATGHPTTITYPSGARVDITYGTDGRAQNMSITFPGSPVPVPLVTNIQYSPSGEAAAWTWGNSTAEIPNNYVRTFDTQGRLASYQLGNLRAGGFVRTLNYDAVGRIKAISHSGTERAQALDQQYDYDDLDRLVGFRSQETTQSFSYDNNGNRIRTSFGAASYNNEIGESSNRLISTSGPAPAKKNVFDNSGNLLSDGTTSFTYDVAGRMETSLTGGGITRYRYNGMGQRVAKRSSTGANFFFYNVEGLLIGEYDDAGIVIEETVYLGSTPVAVIPGSSRTIKDRIYYVSPDHINTPRLLARESDNQAIWRWDSSDPFGLFPPNENPSGLAKFTYNLRFPGQFYDKETNTHYNYFRDYDPQTGRYMQSDPIGLVGGINTFTYVRGNPVRSADPWGLVDIYVGGAKDGTTKIVNSWVEKNSTGSPHFEWTQYSELSEYISKVPANEPINLYGHSYGGDTAAWAAIHMPGRINSLTTLDPVSRIKPNLKRLRCSVGIWRNVNATPSRSDRSDTIAWWGGKWGSLPSGIASSFADVNANHGDFSGLMNGISTSGSAVCGCPSK